MLENKLSRRRVQKETLHTPDLTKGWLNKQHDATLPMFYDGITLCHSYYIVLLYLLLSTYLRLWITNLLDRIWPQMWMVLLDLA